MYANVCAHMYTHTCHMQHVLHTQQTCTCTHLRFLWLCSLYLSIKGRDHSDGPVQEPLHILLAAVGRGLNSVPLPPLSSLHSIDEPQFMGVNCAHLYGLCIHTMQNKQYYMVQLLNKCTVNILYSFLGLSASIEHYVPCKPTLSTHLHVPPESTLFWMHSSE